MRCIREAYEDVGAACAPLAIKQLHTAFAHIVVEGVGAPSQPASEGGCVPVLFGILDRDFWKFLY